MRLGITAGSHSHAWLEAPSSPLEGLSPCTLKQATPCSPRRPITTSKASLIAASPNSVNSA